MSSASTQRDELVASVLSEFGFRSTRSVVKVTEFRNSRGLIVYQNKELAGETVGLVFPPDFERTVAEFGAKSFRNDDMLDFPKIPGEGKRPTRRGFQVKVPSASHLRALLAAISL